MTSFDKAALLLLFFVFAMAMAYFSGSVVATVLGGWLK